MLSKRAKDVQRCLKHIDSFSNNQASVVAWDSDMLRWMKICLRPNGGPYKGGKFLFEVMFGKHYPKAAPVVSCLTPIYHPNIDCECEEYNVCLSMLDDWQETYGLEDLIQGLLYLMYHPNLDDPLSPMFGGNLDYENYVRNVRRSLQGHQIGGVSFEKMIEENKEEDESIVKEYIRQGGNTLAGMVSGLVQDVLDKVSIVPIPSFERCNVEESAQVHVDEGCVGYVPENITEALSPLPNANDINNAIAQNSVKDIKELLQQGLTSSLATLNFPPVASLPSPQFVPQRTEGRAVSLEGLIASTVDCSILAEEVVSSTEDCSVLSGGAVASSELSEEVVASTEDCSVLSGGAVASTELSEEVVASTEDCSVLSGGAVASSELSEEVVASTEDCSVLSGGAVASSELSEEVVASTEDCSVLSGGAVASSELSEEVVASTEDCSVLSGGAVASSELSEEVAVSTEDCSVVSGGVGSNPKCPLMSQLSIMKAEIEEKVSNRLLAQSEDCGVQTESADGGEGACSGECRMEEIQRLSKILDDLMQRTRQENEKVEAAIQQSMMQPSSEDVRNIVTQHGVQSERAQFVLESIQQALSDMLPNRFCIDQVRSNHTPPPQAAKPMCPIPIPDILQKVDEMIQNIEEHGEPTDDIPTDSDTYFTEDEDDDDSFDDDDEDNDDDDKESVAQNEAAEKESSEPDLPVYCLVITLGVVLSHIVDLGNMFARQ